MAQEIERKFLVASDAWRAQVDQGTAYRQGYIATVVAGQSVRVRIAGDTGLITIKGPTTGLSRAEFEYPIPLADAAEMLNTLCMRPLIEKTRYLLTIGAVVWEIDVFHGDNEGLVVAEVELETVDQEVALPDWIGAEVSADPRYFNSSLVDHPFSSWAD